MVALEKELLTAWQGPPRLDFIVETHWYRVELRYGGLRFDKPEQVSSHMLLMFDGFR
jgi:hypothetical protein